MCSSRDTKSAIKTVTNIRRCKHHRNLPRSLDLDKLQATCLLVLNSSESWTTLSLYSLSRMGHPCNFILCTPNNGVRRIIFGFFAVLFTARTSLKRSIFVIFESISHLANDPESWEARLESQYHHQTEVWEWK